MTTRLALLAAAAAGLVACGGGGGGGPAPAPARTLRLEMAIDRSGYLRDDGRWATANDSLPACGDDGGNLEGRGIVSILLRDVPPGATVDSAVLNWYASVSFGDAYGDFGDAILDHVDVGVAFESSDFNGGVLTSPLLVLPRVTQGFPGQLQTIDVTSAVRRDLLAGRLVSSFRLVFPLAPSIDGAPDMLAVSSYLDVPIRMPHIVLTYR